jgi:hypothetical protein
LLLLIVGNYFLNRLKTALSKKFIYNLNQKKMKKTLFIAAFAFITFNSCNKVVTSSEGGKQDNMMQANIMTNSQTSALVTHQHFDLPGPYDLINQCTGETVTVTGTIGDDMHIVINGNTMNFSEHQQGQLHGTGSLGNAYLTNLNENVTLNGISSVNGVFIIDDVTVFRMISTNGAANFMVRRIAHLTITANGIVTVNRIDLETSCP